MKITSVRVYPVNGTSNIVANASITIDDAIVIYCKVVEGKNGKFLSLPNHSYENENGERVFKDDVYFLDGVTRDMVLDKILDELEKVEEKPKAKKTTKRR